VTSAVNLTIYSSLTVYIKCSELDPHGAFGDGNPVGGNVTSNITGKDENLAEWMVCLDYISSLTDTHRFHFSSFIS